VAVLTGARVDVRRAVALALAEAGAWVTAFDLNGDPAILVDRRIRSAGRLAMVVRVEVTSRACVNWHHSKSRKVGGGTTILVPCPGTVGSMRLPTFMEGE
jgi:NAD(P)-dependent dehydrogenase (short-subunit alcohol dehydrogenase family)